MLNNIFLGLSLLALISTAQAATYTVTTNAASGTGSLRWAVAESNNSSGADIVVIPAKFNANNPIKPEVGFASNGYNSTSPIVITDDITIRGVVSIGNAKPVIEGRQFWVTTGGLRNASFPFDTGSTVIHPSGLLFRINQNNAAGRTIEVNIENLQFQGLGGFLRTDNADVIVDNVIVKEIVSSSISTLLITHQLGGSLTIKNSLFFENRVASNNQVFVINNDLTILNSAFSSNYVSTPEVSANRLLSMYSTTGGNVIIRDSYFDHLGQTSILIDGFDVEITNTLFDGRDATSTRSIKVVDGDLTLTNSTLYYRSKTSNSYPVPLYQGTHIELAGTAQLMASNNLFLSTNAADNTLPLIYPADWNNTATYTRAVDQNNYISVVGGDDSALKMSPINCSNRKCFIPNNLSVALVDQGDNAVALYGDGTPIILDYLKEFRPQGASIDIGAYEKHETLAPHNDHYQTDEGIALNITAVIGVLANDTTPGGILATVSKTALHGTVNLNGDGSFDYTPNGGYYGQDEFEYDLGGKQATVTIEVRSTGWSLIPGNQQPIAITDSYTVYTTDVLNVAAPGLLMNDSDDQNTVAPFYKDLIARLDQAPIHGSVIINGDGSFTYVPDAGYVGRDTFTYDVVDGGLQHSVPQTVGITVKVGTVPGWSLGKAKVGTEKGGVTWGFISVFLTLMLLRFKKITVLMRLFLSFVLLLSMNTQAAETNTDKYKGFTVDLGMGVSLLSPDLGATEWEQDKKYQPNFGFGIGYQFDQNWSVDVSYHWLNHANLQSNDANYADTEIHYHLLSANTKYRFNQLWGNEYAPFVILGVGYLNATVNGDSSLVEIEHDAQFNYGLGVNLSDSDLGRIDISWKKITGDVQVFELKIVLDIVE